MRPQADLPRRPRRPRVEGHGRTILIVAVVGLFVLIVSLRGIAGFYTDYLWFDSLHLGSVWRGVLGAKIALAVIFTALFFALCWANLLIADRIAPGVPACWPRRGLPRALPRPRRHQGRAGPVLGRRSVRDHRRGEHVRSVERLDPVHPQGRLRSRRTPPSTPTSASTCSNCRS